MLDCGFGNFLQVVVLLKLGRMRNLCQFRDLFALIVGRNFREGIDILPIVLASNVLAGVTTAATLTSTVFNATQVAAAGEKGPLVSLTRIHPNLVKRLFEQEVVEIKDGTVVIKSIAREAGSRTKIAVYSNDDNVEAVGSCIGKNSMRINAILAELSGEKVDVIKYSDDICEYVKEALSPARVLDVYLEDERTCRVTVSPDQLSLAIGKEGQNVRLAAKLTGCKIDIKGVKI